ncbi:MAG: hypothetical protein RL026_698 [Pseudomonadota bacterium]|jgi:hypothetical protein
MRWLWLWLLPAATLATAGTLPEERADLLYHRYSGGGVTVDGPSMLVRKQFGESVSVSANYYVDLISSASVDVVTTASPYTEEREQKSLAVDYLRGQSTYSAGVVNSSESDYVADTAWVSVAHEMFGDMTTVTLGYSQGRDEIGKRGDPLFREQLDRRNYRFGLTQVLTRELLAGVNLETITEQGYLQSPYRSLRYLTPQPGLWAYGPEQYPGTRTSTAAAARLKGYLPWRASAELHYRYFTDTWGVRAHTAGLEYLHPVGDRWTLSGRYRHYRQGAADFYADLFPRADAQNFMGRDKEYSTFRSHALGLGASYRLPWQGPRWLARSAVTLQLDRSSTRYQDFRNLVGRPPGSGTTPGTEPLYALDATVVQVYLSAWY